MPNRKPGAATKTKPERRPAASTRRARTADLQSSRRHNRPASETGEVRPGRPLPLGAHPSEGGVNFALFSRHATRVWLEFYARPEDDVPKRVIELKEADHRTGDIWHAWVEGVRPGQHYAYRLDGPYRPEDGHRYNPNRLLLDPYATAIARRDIWDFGAAVGYDPASADLSRAQEDDAGSMPKCIYGQDHFDWEGDRPLSRPWSETVIYETHVRGLTIHPSAAVEHPGTYSGLVEKLPYLKALGITAVELLPVQEFNANELDRTNPLNNEHLKNYWGYNTVGFFAPKASYADESRRGWQKPEFKSMVRACHQAGVEVILDVVFNHTAEGDERGPTLSFRGIDNAIYYMLADDKRYYKDYSGTGNSINANHPVVRDFILDALRYWVLEMHVDGFRFDLASVLDRDEEGNLLPDAPLLERIAEDPILRDTKIIAEAWDAAGAYQVGRFSECRWAEWNGRYRDEVRRFWRGDEGMLGLFAYRICGSADLFERSGKGPEGSINFLTCHDGFTLNDLVSYSVKHNENNAELNRDGLDENYSANYGSEGDSDDPEIEKLRIRQIKNFLLTLFVSRGVPMLLGGDEFRRTQRGNNNAYCQDNEVSWYDWSLVKHNDKILRFTRGMIAFRRDHPVLSREAFYTQADIRFFSASGRQPDWSDPQEKCMGVLILGHGEPTLYLMFNAGTDSATFTLPVSPQNGQWRLACDTSRPSPQDLVDPGAELPLIDPHAYPVGPRTSAILIGEYPRH
jgi:isoamylase